MSIIEHDAASFLLIRHPIISRRIFHRAVAPSSIPLRFPLHEILEVATTHLPITIGTIAPIIILVDPQIGITIDIVLPERMTAM